jgi:hypothetical protein
MDQLSNEVPIVASITRITNSAYEGSDDAHLIFKPPKLDVLPRRVITAPCQIYMA